MRILVFHLEVRELEVIKFQNQKAAILLKQVSFHPRTEREIPKPKCK